MDAISQQSYRFPVPASAAHKLWGILCHSQTTTTKIQHSFFLVLIIMIHITVLNQFVCKYNYLVIVYVCDSIKKENKSQGS